MQHPSEIRASAAVIRRARKKTTAELIEDYNDSKSRPFRQALWAVLQERGAHVAVR